MKSIVSVALIFCQMMPGVPSAAQRVTDVTDRPGMHESTTLMEGQTTVLSVRPGIRAPRNPTRSGQNAPRSLSLIGVANEVEQYRHDRTLMALELHDGSRLAGLVGECLTDRFDLIQTTERRDMVLYDQVAAFLEPDTSEVLAVAGQRGIGGMGRPSIKTTLIVMAVVAAALTYFWSRIPK